MRNAQDRCAEMNIWVTDDISQEAENSEMKKIEEEV